MRLRRRDVLKVATSTAAAAVATKLPGRSAWAGAPTRIVRDVCVIGGGSAGTYAAIQLRNLGKSVALLEKESRLGGHAQTVIVNNVPVNIGVQVFEGSSPLVTSYCSQLNVPLIPIPSSGPRPTANVDFRTGAPVTLPPTDPVALGTAIGTYLQILQTQFPYLESGFNLPNPVPADLLMPFGSFVTKYGLQALVPTVFAFAEGLGDILANPALYILKNFSLSVVGGIATNSFVVVPTGTASLYDAAAGFLGSDAIVNARVLGVVRAADHVDVFAETPDGLVHIEAGKLVFAIPPTLPNVALLEPDALEASLFSRFFSNYYATSLVKFDGVPPGEAITNVAANTNYNLPPLPSMYGLQASAVPNYFVGLFGSQVWLPDGVVKATMEGQLKRVASSGIFPGMKFEGIETFSSHAPFNMMVSPGDIAAGFYSKLNALQGHNRTYYTSAAFQTNDSSLIWRFTQGLLPQITA
ncbi:MAG TPA: FAD-dependent oxidoreductase [Polyangiaceae bacterium]|jgi:hypothetical protein